MSGKMRKPITWLLALAMLTTLLPSMSFAAMATEVDDVSELSQTQDGQPYIQEEAASSDETEEFITETETYSADPEIDLPSNEELFSLYADQVLYGYEADFFGTAAGDKLSGDEKLAYDALKSVIEDIAAGKRASTSVSLGYGSYNVNVGGTIENWTPDVEVQFTEKRADFDHNKVISALLSDCPYEMYWYDKTEGNGCAISALTTENLCYIKFSFSVAGAYSSGTYLADIDKTKAATTAAANARDVVSDNASKSDYEKLVAYKEYICGAVSYNDEAADDGYTGGYGDPWQLIYVFDGDVDTEVVCEGYSKAFQYLCDLSGLSCISVSGVMYVFYGDGSSSGGDHMWNIVTLEHENYLVDVTNSDGDSETGFVSVGYDGSLFLVGGTAAENGQYNFDTIGDTVTAYLYDSETTQLWSEAELTLAQTNYTPPQDGGSTDSVSGYCGGEGDGTNLTWELTGDGVLTISGTGEMANYSDSNPAPWSDRKASIVKVVMDDNATTVGGAAFLDCANLSQVKLPAALKLIRYDSFRGCTSLANIAIPDTVTFIGSAAFRGCTALTQVELPAALTDLYGEAFYGCTALQSITIPDTVTYFGQSVFCDCTSLKQVELPDSLTTVQDYLFDGCTSLESVTIPDTVRNIGNAVFRGCTSLKQIDLPAALLSIDYWTFSGCTALESITIPDTVISMGDSVFTGCTSLTQVQLSAKLETIEYYTFAGCAALESITIPASVTTIDEYAFYSCTALKSIVIPANVTGIEEKAFLKCTALKEITFEGGAPAIADTAFTDVTATAYYPSDDATWTAEKRKNYGGEITWVAEEPTYIYFADLTYDLSIDSDGQSWREYRNTYVDGKQVIYQFDAAAEVIEAPGLYTIDAIDEDGVVTALSPVALDLGTVKVVDGTSFMFTRGDGTTSTMGAVDAVFVMVETNLEGEVTVRLGEISDLEAQDGFETAVAVVKAEESNANLVYVFVTEQAPAEVNYTFQQSTQLGLIEPWFLKSNLYVKSEGTYLTEAELNSLKDFGVYFVRGSELGNPTELPDVETIINDTHTIKYSKNGDTCKAVVEEGSVGYMITASFEEGIYTYELNDPVYVLFYIEDESGIRYDVVKKRDLLALAEKGEIDSNFDQTERNVYTRMIEMHETITAHRATFDSIPEMVVQDAPKVKEGQFGTYKTGQSANYSVNVVLIEPWGVRLNAYIDGSIKTEESGFVIFYDKDKSYTTAPTIEQLISNENAYVFSTADGTASAELSGSNTRTMATYAKDIFTYQLNNNIYAAFFVKSDGVYHFGDVKTRNVLDYCNRGMNNTSFTETERAVYEAMINMHTDVTVHRAKFGL